MTQAAAWGVQSAGPATPAAFAARVNDSLAALRALHKGATRPAYAVAGMLWIDDTPSPWTLNLFDGAADRPLATINPTSGAVSLLGTLSAAGVDALQVPRENMLLNARGLINQRSYVSGAATSGANQYTLDLWRVVVSGQSLSWTESGGVRTMTAPAGGVEQVVAGSRVLAGTYTINWTGTATCTVAGASVAKGATVVLTGGASVTVRFSGGTFSQPRLTLGAFPAPLAPVDDLHECQAYYCRIDAGARFDGVLGGAAASAGHTVFFPRAMHAAPTATVLAQANTNASNLTSIEVRGRQQAMLLWEWTAGTTIVARIKNHIVEFVANPT
jgi:hypothetical protein